MQLKTRLTLQFVLAVAPILLISFFVIYWSSAKYREKEFYERLEKKALTTAEFLIEVDLVDSTLLKLIDRTQKDRLPEENITVYNYLNKEIYTNNDTLYYRINDSLINEIRLNKNIHFTQNEFEITGMTYNGRYNRFVVIAGAQDVFGLSKLKNLRNTLFALFFIITGLSAFAGWLYSSRALMPISNVIKKAENISAKNLGERLPPPKYNDEIGALVNAFNTMLARIEDAFKMQKLFMAGASHELKNPLTVITTQLQVAQLKERTVDEYKQTIASVLDDIKELNKLTLGLIDFARLSQDDMVLAFEPQRLDEFVGDFAVQFKKRNPGYTINYRIEWLPEDENKLTLNINADLLYTALANLADNACKFSPTNKVDIVLQETEGALSLCFINDGPAIAPDDRPFIFEPFYRSKQPVPVKGHGIGLALVAKIVALHGGIVFLADDVNGHTAFKIVFPNI